MRIVEGVCDLLDTEALHTWIHGIHRGHNVGVHHSAVHVHISIIGWIWEHGTCYCCSRHFPVAFVAFIASRLPVACEERHLMELGIQVSCIWPPLPSFLHILPRFLLCTLVPVDSDMAPTRRRPVHSLAQAEARNTRARHAVIGRLIVL